MTTSGLSVPLEEISTCFEGIIPSPIATVGPDGEPNVTYLSVVHRVDENHVALSRQFFNKTEENTDAIPYAQIWLHEPSTGRQFYCDLVYERTETEGPLFERMRTNLDAVAAMEGMANIFQLKGTDICRVEACWMMPCDFPESSPRRSVKIDRLEAVCRRVSAAEDLDALLVTTLRGCEDLLGNGHAFIMLAGPGERLYTVESTGYPFSGAGSEVLLGDGLIGMAAARRQTVRLTHLSRDLSYSHAIRDSARRTSGGPADAEQVIPLPTLSDIQSQMIVPMLAYHELVGVICLQSHETGAFQADDESVIGILANQVAMAVDRLQSQETPSLPAAPPAPREGAAVQVKHYRDDDSVFLDNEYLIKGVAGGILWRLLTQYQEEGREEFSNREIRLDQSLELPDIKDNLEARLILLRKRLEERCASIRIERTGRGRFRLVVERPITLVSAQGESPF